MSRLVGVGPGTASTAEFSSRRRVWRLDEFGREVLAIGRRLLLFFLAFTTIGYAVIETIPTDWMTEYLGSDSLLARASAPSVASSSSLGVASSHSSLLSCSPALS